MRPSAIATADGWRAAWALGPARIPRFGRDVTARPLDRARVQRGRMRAAVVGPFHRRPVRQCSSMTSRRQRTSQVRPRPPSTGRPAPPKRPATRPPSPEPAGPAPPDRARVGHARRRPDPARRRDRRPRAGRRLRRGRARRSRGRRSSRRHSRTRSRRSPRAQPEPHRADRPQRPDAQPADRAVHEPDDRRPRRARSPRRTSARIGVTVRIYSPAPGPEPGPARRGPGRGDARLHRPRGRPRQGANDFTATLYGPGGRASRRGRQPTSSTTPRRRSRSPRPAKDATVNGKTVTIVGKTQARSTLVARNEANDASVTGIAEDDGTFQLDPADRRRDRTGSGSPPPTRAGTRPRRSSTSAAAPASCAPTSPRRATSSRASGCPSNITLTVSRDRPGRPSARGATVTFTLTAPGVPPITRTITTDGEGQRPLDHRRPEGAPSDGASQPRSSTRRPTATRPSQTFITSSQPAESGSTARREAQLPSGHAGVALPALRDPPGRGGPLLGLSPLEHELRHLRHFRHADAAGSATAASTAAASRSAATRSARAGSAAVDGGPIRSDRAGGRRSRPASESPNGRSVDRCRPAAGRRTVAASRR